MEIRRYFAIAQRWAWLVIIGAVVGGAAAYLYSANRAPVYSAQARLLIDQAPGSSGGNEYTQILVEQRLATTYVELITLSPVLEATVDRLDLPFGADELARLVSATAPPDTQLIVVSVEDTSPVRSSMIANTLADVFIEQNQLRQSARYQESIDNWQSRLEELELEISALESQIAGFGLAESPEEEAELSQLETNLRGAELRYTEAFNNLEELRVEEARATNNVVLVEPARPQPQPIRPRPIPTTILGAIAGAMLAVGIVFLIEYLDDTVKSPEQVEEETGLSTVGAIAIIKGNEPHDRLVSFNTPRSPISEAYRVLRTNLSFSAIDEGLRAVLVTSASPGEGKSTTAANLAVVIAQTGKRVILVDSDLRRPSQHLLFGIANDQGLTTALLDTATPLAEHLQETRVPNIHVLASGPIPPNPAELLNSQRMTNLLLELRDAADTIVLDTPPTLTVADASILAPQMSGCILVAQMGRTRMQALDQARDTLQKSGAHLLGVVLNQVQVGRAGYYYRYYSYEYTGKDARPGLLRLPNWITSRRS